MVNPLAGLVLVGTGCYASLLAAASIASGTPTLREAVQNLPRALRGSHAETREIRLAAESLISFQTFALVGYSQKRRRMIGVVFDSRQEFEPIERPWTMSPSVLGDVNVSDEQSAIAYATEQTVWHRRSNPSAYAGVLTFAEITLCGIRCRALWDLERGVPANDGSM